MGGGTQVLLVAGDDRSGSASVAVASLATLARDRGLEAAVVTGEPGLADLARRSGLTVVATIPQVPGGRLADAVADRVTGGADVVHSVGADATAAVAAALTGAAYPPHVASVTELPTGGLRRGLRRRMPRGGSVDHWLVPGHGCATRLARSRRCATAAVSAVPIVGLTDLDVAAWHRARADARGRLGIPPGVRLVVGSGPGGAGADRLAEALARLSRGDVRGLWVQTDAVAGPVRAVSPYLTVVDLWGGRALLPAMDLAVVTGTGLTARSVAVDAARIGLPVVATPEDPVADVLAAAPGARLAPRRDLASGIATALDLGPAAGPRAPAHHAPAPDEELTAVTARVYELVLGRPLMRPTLTARRGGR